ncbi:MAG: Kef-type potassium/proton antiporter, family [Burkholderiales bacterium]|jgi:monovalent cation:proton antiporter-2 (CPA2) family protein|nr:Kef-type potassium/proton antiporter, family [Burkholderiales bacterium]
MTYTNIFTQAFIYLLATVITVPIAKRIGFGSVLGYLLAGIIIGPYVLGLVGGSDGVMQVAEFGVVMMLFLVGLELRPAMLWNLRKPLLLTGGLQVIITALVITLIAKFFKLSWAQAFTIGIVFTSSSTAIVLQLLNEKGWIKLEAGSTIFAVLLFQDIAIIPMLAIFPLLGASATKIDHHSLPGWIQAGLILLLLGTIIFAGKFLFRPVFRFIANSKLHEAFTALALLLVIGIALAMEFVGLSPALGAFLAGVVLAESEYRHELEADIEPFKGLLLGLFFMSVGSTINFALITEHILIILMMVALLVAVKFCVMYILGNFFQCKLRDNLLIAMTLAQGGEFCFVLLSYALKEQILPAVLVKELVAVVALSMLLTPLIMLFYEKVLEPRFIAGFVEGEPDVVEQNNPVLIAGFGRFGQVVARLMLANGIGTTVLDIDANQVESVRKFGFKVFYGDGQRLELLNQAGLRHAKILVVAIDNTEVAVNIVAIVKQAYPDIKILLRVRSRTDVYDGLKNGVKFEHVYRETFDSALHMATDALRELGINEEMALSSAKKFKKIDEDELIRMYKEFGGQRLDDGDYVSQVRAHIKELEGILSSDRDVLVGKAVKFN